MIKSPNFYDPSVINLSAPPISFVRKNSSFVSFLKKEYYIINESKGVDEDDLNYYSQTFTPITLPIV